MFKTFIGWEADDCCEEAHLEAPCLQDLFVKVREKIPDFAFFDPDQCFRELPQSPIDWTGEMLGAIAAPDVRGGWRLAGFVVSPRVPPQQLTVLVQDLTPRRPPTTVVEIPVIDR
jgi:hypothetical protein